MWVAAQVFAHADPSFDVFEFAEWCGIDTRTRSGRPRRSTTSDDATGSVD
jgi:hypothetical protein